MVHWKTEKSASTVNLQEFEALWSTLPTLGESLVLVAAWSRQEGTGGGFFWIISLKQVEKWAGAGSEAWPFFLSVRLSFSAALQGRREVACHTTETYGVASTDMLQIKPVFTHTNCCFNIDINMLTWLKGTWQQCWRWSPLWICEGSLS